MPAEGQNVTATATATGTGPLEFDWSVTEDGIEIDSGTNTGVNPNDPVLFDFVLPDDTEQMEHEYKLLLTVTDSDSTSASAMVDLEVTNVAPVLVVAPDQAVNEGQLLNLSGVGAPPLALFVDAGKVDTHTATVDWGDGSPLENATVFFSNGSGALGGTHTYADDGVYTVIVTVLDDDGGSDTESFDVTVNNVPPVVVPAPDQMVDEGQLLNLSGIGAPPLALFVDAGKVDTHTATIDWGDGSPLENATVFFSNGSGALGGTHTYADDGIYTVTVTVLDDDGDSDTESFDVTVNNVPPVVVPAPDQMVNEGQLLDLSGVGAPPLALFVDAGKIDTHTATIDWGDGSAIENATVFFSNGSGALGGTHTYAENGVYTVTITVTDDNGGSDTETFEVIGKERGSRGGAQPGDDDQRERRRHAHRQLHRPRRVGRAHARRQLERPERWPALDVQHPGHTQRGWHAHALRRPDILLVHRRGRAYDHLHQFGYRPGRLFRPAPIPRRRSGARQRYHPGYLHDQRYGH